MENADSSQTEGDSTEDGFLGGALALTLMQSEALFASCKYLKTGHLIGEFTVNRRASSAFDYPYAG